MTKAMRTLFDLAPTLGPQTLVKVVDSALMRNLVRPAALRHALELPGQRNRAGSKALRAALAPWFLSEVLDSGAEADFLRLVVAADIPIPAAQYEIRVGHEVIAKVDFAWPDRLVALEVEGYRFHGGATAWGDDIDRTTSITSLGWVLLRTSPHHMAKSPDGLIASIAAHLGA